METVFKYIGILVGLLLFVTCVILLAAIPTMYVWNALVPDITKGALTEITYVQAILVNFLSTLLFYKPDTTCK